MVVRRTAQPKGGLKMSISEEKNFMSNRKIYWLISLAVVAAGIIITVLSGVVKAGRLDSGALYEYKTKEAVSVSDAEPVTYTDAAQYLKAVTGYEFSALKNDDAIVVTMPSTEGFESITAGQIEQHLERFYPALDMELVRGEMHEQSTSKGIAGRALVLLAVAFLAMAVYIGRRFRSIGGWVTAISCAAALFLDCFAAFVSIVIFAFPMDETVAAAVIAAMGCSVNAAIIVFDCIRENYRFFGESVEIARIADRSIEETGRRVIVTNSCLICAMLILAIVAAVMGVEGIAKMCVPILFAVFSSCFTSLFTASSLWVSFKEKQNKK